MEASILRKRWWITKNYFVFIVLSLFNVFTPLCWAQMSIVNTKHNLSVTGPGTIKSLVETRICIFCHTPHNAAPKTPLWNKDLEPINYVLYSSSTMTAKTNQPTGPSRLCLSCHDGTIALGDVRVPSNDIQVMGQIQTTSPSYIGTILSDDHAVSFSYYDSLPNPELAPTPHQGSYSTIITRSTAPLAMILMMIQTECSSESPTHIRISVPHATSFRAGPIHHIRMHLMSGMVHRQIHGLIPALQRLQRTGVKIAMPHTRQVDPRGCSIIWKKRPIAIRAIMAMWHPWT